MKSGRSILETDNLVGAITERFLLAPAASANCRDFVVDFDLLFFMVTDNEISCDKDRSVLEDLYPGKFCFFLGLCPGLGGYKFIAFQIGERPGWTGIDNMHDFLAVGGMNVDPKFFL